MKFTLFRPPNIWNKKILKRLRLCEGAKRPSPRERSDRAGGRVWEGGWPPSHGKDFFQFWPPNGSIWCILLHTKIWNSTLPIPHTFPAAPAGIVARYTRPQSWQWMLQSAHCRLQDPLSITLDFWSFTVSPTQWHFSWSSHYSKRQQGITVEPRYNEVLGTMKYTLLYQVSHNIRVKLEKFDCAQSTGMPPPSRILHYCLSLWYNNCDPASQNHQKVARHGFFS